MVARDASTMVSTIFDVYCIIDICGGEGVEIVKVCKKHGKLTLDETHKDKSRKGAPRFRCGYCRREQATKSANKYRDRTRAYSNKWREDNPDERRKYGRDARKKYIEELHDLYIKDRLNRSHGIKASEVTPEMIEIKRVMIKINRKKKDDSSKNL